MKEAEDLKKVEELDNIELILFVLRRLWRFWDAGGISQGRSPITIFLEPAKRLLTHFEDEYTHFEEVELVGDYELMLEVKKRQPTPHQRLLPIFTKKAEHLDRLSLAYFLLKNCVAYIKEKCHNDLGPYYVFERKMLEGVLRILNIQVLKRSFDGAKLVIAADDIFHYEQEKKLNFDLETDL